MNTMNFNKNHNQQENLNTQYFINITINNHTLLFHNDIVVYIICL